MKPIDLKAVMTLSHKVAIAVKEANESCYWFKVLRGLCGSNERIERWQKRLVNCGIYCKAS